MHLIFRVLVSLAMIATALFWSMPYIDYMWYPTDQLSLLDQNGLGASLHTGIIFYWFELGLWLIVSLGLFFYIPIARTAFIVLYLALTPLIFFSGIQVLTPIETFLSSILGLLDGAIIAIMYFTSVSEKFNGAPYKHRLLGRAHRAPKL